MGEMRLDYYVIGGINPTPWQVGPVSTARQGAAKKLISYVAGDPEVKSYQHALRTWFITNGIGQLEPPYQLMFFWWRQIVTYQGEKRMVTKRAADQTNMQKATEDALQPSKDPKWEGLIDNDRNCSFSAGLIMEQTKETVPALAIQILSGIPKLSRPAVLVPTDPLAEVVDAVKKLQYEDLDAFQPVDNAWPPREGIQ